MLEIILLSKENRHLVQSFLNNASKALEQFRYFNTRSLDILDNHIATYLISINGQHTGYGHLDLEEDTVWLGIAIADQYQGLGLGHLMMQLLVASAKINQLPSIQLSVDNPNEKAIRLYYKFGFRPFKSTNQSTFMKLVL